MGTQFQTRFQVPKGVSDPVRGMLLQRKCACSPRMDRSVSGFLKPGFEHSLGNVRMEAADRSGDLAEDRNSFRDGDPIHQPLIDAFRRREGLPQGGVDKSGERVGPSDAEIKYGGLTLPCPTSTEVESTVDLTPSGLAQGYLTGYGIMAKMRVHPDHRNWNGTRIAESLTEVPGTCPAGLTKPGPCEAGPPFTVGDPSKGSSVHAAEPGLRNRFYDFHRTRSNLSVLHDATRNPAGLNSCQTACKQVYSCDGQVIGQHLITRTFRKGTFGGKNVTIIDVTKT